MVVAASLPTPLQAAPAANPSRKIPTAANSVLVERAFISERRRQSSTDRTVLRADSPGGVELALAAKAHITIDMAIRIDVREVQALLAESAQLVEVLPADEYEEQHLPGAVSIPLKELNADTTARLDRGRPVIVYCWDSI